MKARKQTSKVTRKRPASPPQLTDYALIVDCMTILAATVAENPTLIGDPDGNWEHANAAMKPLQAAKDRALPRMLDTPAQTPDGLIAKANLAPYIAGDSMIGFRHASLACAYAASLARDVVSLVKSTQAAEAVKGGAK